MMFIAIPSGFLTDRLGREQIIRGAAVVGLLATAAISIALWWKVNCYNLIRTSHPCTLNTWKRVHHCQVLSKGFASELHIFRLLTQQASQTLAYGIMLGGLITYGLYNGLVNPALEAMFADSVATGNR